MLCTNGASRITDERTPRSANAIAAVLRVDPRSGGQGVFFGGGPALDEGHHQRSGRADERLTGADENLAHRLDGTQIRLDGAEEVAEVVVEGQVDDAVGCGRARAQTVEVVEVAAVRLGAHGLQRRGGLGPSGPGR